LTNEELNAALNLTRKIDRLQARLDDLRKTGGLRSPGMDTPVQGGTGPIGIGQIVAELAQEIEELKKQREIERVVIGRQFEKLPFEDMERKVANLRYVRCMAWKNIESAIGYSRAQVFRIHEKIKLILNETS
jgi:DNA-directed RNA polymerase specialized sigma subunit